MAEIDLVERNENLFNHLGLEMNVCVNKLGYQTVSCRLFEAGHYVNICWFVADWTRDQISAKEESK